MVIHGIDSDAVYTLREAAVFLRRHWSSVTRMVQRGKLARNAAGLITGVELIRARGHGDELAAMQQAERGRLETRAERKARNRAAMERARQFIHHGGRNHGRTHAQPEAT